MLNASLKMAALLIVGGITASCGGPTEQTETAEDFAARINLDGPQASNDAPETLDAVPATAENAGNVTTPTGPSNSPPEACDAKSAAAYIGQTMTAQLQQAMSAHVPMGGALLVVNAGDPIIPSRGITRLIVVVDGNGNVSATRCD